MKNRKKGFTLIEIIVCLSLLMLIVGIFAVNFITNLNSNREKEYKDAVDILESAADAYVMTIKDEMNPIFDDIKSVMENVGSFSYIALEELEDNGFINEKNTIDPSTNEQFRGVVKFENVEGRYDFEYIDDPENIVTILFDKNGADSIDRTAQAVYCEDESDAVNCTETIELPEITRVGGRVYGWSTAYDAFESDHKPSSKVSTLLESSHFTVVKNKIKIYAITSEDKTIYFDTLKEDLGTPDKLSCTVYNTTSSCEITMPDYQVDIYHEKKGWNTNENITGDDYAPLTKVRIDKNITLYKSKEVKPFDVLINKLNRVSSTTVVPSNINIVLVLDISGSMSSNNRLNNLKTVTMGLADRINYDNSTVSLITFSSSSSTRLSYNTDRLRIKSEIARLTAYGGTSFTSAISAANALVSNAPNDKESFVILVSDGISNIQSNYPALISLKSKAQIFTMGLGINADNVYLQTMASKPENFYRYNETIDSYSLKDFYKLFDDIVENIMILQGDGIENAIETRVNDGKLELGNLILSEKYPLDIYLDGKLISSMPSENEYFYEENGLYYFDVYNFACKSETVGLARMHDLRIKFFIEEDK